MKLLVAGMEYLRRYVSREFFYTMRDLIHIHGWMQIDNWELWNLPGSMEEKLIGGFGEIPEAILFWEGYEFCALSLGELNRLKCHKCFFADDLHRRDEWETSRNREVLSIFDTILTSYEYAFDRYFPGLRGTRKIAWVPHAASPDYHLPFNENPENALLLSGAVSPAYPLREQVRQMQSGVVVHPHPGYHCEYDYGQNDSVGKAHARKINRYRAAFTDSSYYEYLVAKYFEIPATGALLLAEGALREPLATLGFIEGTHYLAVSAANLKERVQYVLDDKHIPEIDGIRRRGQALVGQRHKTSDRSRLIDELCATK